MKNKFLEGGIPKVAEVLGLNERTIYREAKLGKFPFIKKVASRYVVIEDSFNDWMFTSAVTELKKLKESQCD